MGIKIKDDNRIPGMLKIIERINRGSIEIGVFGEDDSFMLMIANVHEFGMTIRPKGQFLAIPTPLAKGKRPRDFPDLVFVPIAGGSKGLLVREQKGRGRLGARSEVYFILVRSVTIPERSFIRSTADENEGRWSKVAGQLLGRVLDGKISVETFFDRLGQLIVSDIQTKIKAINEPPNAAITQANKGSSSPLIDSGRMRQSVTYKVVFG